MPCNALGKEMEKEGGTQLSTSSAVDYSEFSITKKFPFFLIVIILIPLWSTWAFSTDLWLKELCLIALEGSLPVGSQTPFCCALSDNALPGPHTMQDGGG